MTSLSGKETQDVVKAKILIVDDRKENLGALESLLSKDGVEIIKANSGREALELLLVHDFALALLDVQMPEINGFELAELMRGSEQSRTVPIIFITAGAIDQKHTFRGYEAGAVDFLYKPLDPRIVRSKVSVFLELDRHKKLLITQLEEVHKGQHELSVLTQSLSDQQKWLRAILNMMPTPLELFCQERKKVFFSNQAAILLIGQRKEDGSLAKYFFYSDSDGKRLPQEETPESLVASRKKLTAYEITLECPGFSIPVIYNSDTLPATFGHESATVITFQDLRKVKEVEVELKAAKDRAESASQSKSAFLANMSHEIRTPLGAILGFAELLKDPKKSSDQNKKYVDIIMKNGRILAQLIDDILDIAKVEAGKLEIEKTRFSLRELMTDIISLLSLKAEVKGLEFELIFPDQVPDYIESDSLRLRQVLVNIIGNAIKFTDAGKISVRIESEELETGKRLFIFSVHDTGHGITEEQRGNLFQPFSQADNSITRKFGGTGLGLLLSQRLSESLGGDVHLAQSSPQGSTFVVRVKSQGGVSTPSDASIHTHKASFDAVINLRGVKILMVDDSADNQTLVKQFLSRKGAIVDFANNGQEGIDRALASDYDLILMDIQMPVLDGYAATKELRKRGFKKPIVALSAHAMKEDRDKSLEVGCNEHLSKPIDPVRLVETVAHFTS